MHPCLMPQLGFGSSASVVGACATPLLLLSVPPLARGSIGVPAPCLAAGFPTAFCLLTEQKRDVYDRYGKDGLMGAGEWALVPMRGLVQLWIRPHLKTRCVGLCLLGLPNLCGVLTQGST